MTRTDVGAACEAAEGIGEVGQLKRRKGLDVRMPGPKVRHISRLLLEGRVTGVASEWSGGLGRLSRGQGSGCGGLGGARVDERSIVVDKAMVAATSMGRDGGGTTGGALGLGVGVGANVT